MTNLVRFCLQQTRPYKRGSTIKRWSTITQHRVKPEEARPVFAVQLQDVDLVQVLRLGLEEFIFQAGMLLVHQVMEAEAESLAGRRYERGEDKGHYRWGSQKSSIYLQGQKKTISRPLVMKKEKVDGKR